MKQLIIWALMIVVSGLAISKINNNELAVEPLALDQYQLDHVTSGSSAWGNSDVMYLYGDGYFIRKGSTLLSSNDGTLCYEGHVLPDDQEDFFDEVKNSVFFDTDYSLETKTKEHLEGLLCEGRDWFNARIDGNFNQLSSPCLSDEYSEKSRQVEALREELSLKLKRLIEGSSRQNCQIGTYFWISKLEPLSSCDELLKDKTWGRSDYIKLDTDNLDPIIEGALKYKYFYAGGDQEKINSYSDNFYELDGTCFILREMIFDGDSIIEK